MSCVVVAETTVKVFASVLTLNYFCISHREHIVFFQFEIIARVLVSYFRFISILMLCNMFPFQCKDRL